MAYDNDDDRPSQRPTAAKMSKTPSWIMLGFVLGALFVWALPPLQEQRPPELKIERVPAAPAAPATPRAAPKLTTIEAVFEQWQEHAVWSDGTTEVALWNTQDRAYTDFYEVRRYGAGTLYFRSIPRLTRRVISRGKPIPECPLQFTETEEQYQEWRQYGRTERPGANPPSSKSP